MDPESSVRAPDSGGTSGQSASSPSHGTSTSGASEVESLKTQVSELRRKVTSQAEQIQQRDARWVEAIQTKVPNGDKVIAAISGDTSAMPSTNMQELLERALVDGDVGAFQSVLTQTVQDAVNRIEKKLGPQIQRANAAAVDGTVRSFFTDRGIPEFLSEDSPFQDFQQKEVDAHPELGVLLAHNPKLGLEVLYDRYARAHGDPAAEKKADLEARRRAALETAGGMPASVEVKLPPRADGRIRPFEEIASELRKAGAIGRKPPPDDF
jgi:hypothetical protein